MEFLQICNPQWRWLYWFMGNVTNGFIGNYTCLENTLRKQAFRRDRCGKTRFTGIGPSWMAWILTFSALWISWCNQGVPIHFYIFFFRSLSEPFSRSLRVQHSRCFDNFVRVEKSFSALFRLTFLLHIVMMYKSYHTDVPSFCPFFRNILKPDFRIFFKCFHQTNLLCTQRFISFLLWCNHARAYTRTSWHTEYWQ